MQQYLTKCTILFLALSIVGCAKIGSISGGAKDTLAPVLYKSIPKNGAVNFKGKEIKLFFDEYVKLKNVGKQLIVSPPMEQQPDILPYNASKYITIKLRDSLLPNTTYSFNFGQSIEDNNEGNALHQFKYIFSTGNYIDSLALKATVKDALEKKVSSFVSIMLYEVNEKFNDSTIYKQSPRYITNTLDSLKLVKLENLKQGKYQLIALKDNNNNNKYDPKQDKIGFINSYVTIPNDTLFQLELFKEELKFKANRPSQASGNRMIMGYEGNSKEAKITLKKHNEEIPFKITKLEGKDSLQIWFKPFKNDSLNVAVEKHSYKNNFNIKIKDQKKDSLSFSSKQVGSLHFRDQFKINSSIPLDKIDSSKMTLLNKDSLAVKFTTLYDDYNQQLVFDFDKQPLEKYTLTVLPKALIDFYENSNDTLVYKFETRNTSDYGNLRVILENIKRFPVIVELTDNEGKIMATAYSEKETTIDFNSLEPNKFTLRLIYDDNKNKVWDPGNYLEKRQSEEVIYFPKIIDVRPNWDVEQPFNLKPQ